MKRIFILWCFLFIGISDVLYGQTLFTAAEMLAANTAASASYLSAEEKKVILYMNLARIDGSKFYQSFVLEFVESYNNTFQSKLLPNNKYLISLKSDLQKSKGLKVLLPYKNLCLSAAFHANDMGKTGITGHDSSDGTDCFDRINRFFPGMNCGAENCSFGFGSAINIVCQLLIDDGIPSLGHRTNILNSYQKIVGVAIAQHIYYKFNCVMDFSCNQAPAADNTGK